MRDRDWTCQLESVQSPQFCAEKVALALGAGVALQLPLQPRHGHLTERSAIVLAVGAAVANGRVDAVEDRHPRRHHFEVLLAVLVRDVAVAAGDDDHRGMDPIDDLLVLRIKHPTVPDADGRDTRISGGAVGHQAAA